MHEKVVLLTSLRYYRVLKHRCSSGCAAARTRGDPLSHLHHYLEQGGAFANASTKLPHPLAYEVKSYCSHHLCDEGSSQFQIDAGDQNFARY